jgi:hypothetical protein
MKTIPTLNSMDIKTSSNQHRSPELQRTWGERRARHLPLLMLMVAGLGCQAATLDFETINSVIPIEGTAISNQFRAHYGIRFRRRNAANEFPVIAKFGPPEAAFHSNGGADDTLTETNVSAFGGFFLTDDAGSASSGSGIILDFDAPVSQASGYIFDIDGNDVVTVAAYADSAGSSQLAAQVFTDGMPSTGNGRATFWSFSHPARDIRRIDIITAGPAPRNVGYDNFSSDYTPSAQTPAMLGMRMCPGLTIQGDVGRPYRIEYIENLSGTNWVALTNIFLPSSPWLFIDTTTTSPNRFYRAVGIQ